MPSASMNQTLPQRVGAAIVGGSMVLAGLVALLMYDVYSTFTLVAQRTGMQQVALRNLRTIEALQNALVDMQSGGRGYLLSGDMAFLEPFNSGERDFQRELRLAQRDFAADSAQISRIRAVQAMEVLWRQEYALPLIARRREARTPAEIQAIFAQFAEARGKRQADAIRAVFAEMRAGESLQLQQANAGLEGSMDRTRGVMLRTGVLIATLLVWLVFLLLRAFRELRTRNLALSEEIRQRQTAQTRAQVSDSKLHVLVDNLPEGVVTLDSTQLIVECNPMLPALFGRPDAAAVQGRPFAELIEPSEQARVGLMLNRVEASGQTGLSMQSVGRRQDGTSFPIELSLARFELADARLISVIVRDISARRADELKLSEAIALQRAILNSTPYAILSTDTSGTIRTCNRAAQWMFGFLPDELVGKAPLQQVCNAPELVARLRQVETPAADPPPGGESAARLDGDPLECILTRRDGRTFPALVALTTLTVPGGRIIGQVAIVQDVTERHEIERLKREFVATVSHELRSPLTAILGALALVREGETGALPDQAAMFVDMAYQNSERLAALVNDILDMEKLDSGAMTFAMAPVAIRPFLQEAVRLNQGYAEHHGVAYRLAADVPDVTVGADRHRLHQVMANLLSNAAKFSPHGADIMVGGSSDGQRVRITVTDQGPGIPETFRDHIFERFAQADGTDTREKGGTGLGLSICKTIIERMHGQLGFESRTSGPQRGATFYFELPLNQAA